LLIHLCAKSSLCASILESTLHLSEFSKFTTLRLFEKPTIYQDIRDTQLQPHEPYSDKFLNLLVF
jgi:hypothetical protein